MWSWYEADHTIFTSIMILHNGNVEVKMIVAVVCLDVRMRTV